MNKQLFSFALAIFCSHTAQSMGNNPITTKKSSTNIKVKYLGAYGTPPYLRDAAPGKIQRCWIEENGKMRGLEYFYNNSMRLKTFITIESKSLNVTNPKIDPLTKIVLEKAFKKLNHHRKQKRYKSKGLQKQKKWQLEN